MGSPPLSFPTLLCKTPTDSRKEGCPASPTAGEMWGIVVKGRQLLLGEGLPALNNTFLSWAFCMAGEQGCTHWAGHGAHRSCGAVQLHLGGSLHSTNSPVAPEVARATLGMVRCTAQQQVDRLGVGTELGQAMGRREGVRERLGGSTQVLGGLPCLAPLSVSNCGLQSHPSLPGRSP